MQEACRKREGIYRCSEWGHEVSWWVRRRQVIGCGDLRWKEVSSIFVSKYRHWQHETWLNTIKIPFILHCFSTLLQKGPISPRIAPAWSSASKPSDSRQQFSQRRSQRTYFSSAAIFPPIDLLFIFYFWPVRILPVRSSPILSAARDLEGSFGPSLISRVSRRSTRCARSSRNFLKDAGRN